MRFVRCDVVALSQSDSDHNQPREPHPLRIEYGLFNDVDAQTLESVPPNQRLVAALMLTHHTDEQIVSKLDVDVQLIESIREAIFGMFRLPESAIKRAVGIELFPGWPHRPPRWKFWAQPLYFPKGSYPCLRCKTLYRLTWIEDDAISAGSLTCDVCGYEYFTWQSKRNYLAHRNPMSP